MRSPPAPAMGKFPHSPPSNAIPANGDKGEGSSNTTGHLSPPITVISPPTSPDPAHPTHPHNHYLQHHVNTPASRDAYTHGLDLPWVTRDLSHSSSTLLTGSPANLTRGVSELNLSAHPSRHGHATRHQYRTACFVHSLLQNDRARSPSRQGSSEDLTRGSQPDVFNKGPERRDRWNRGMTKKELSDIALGVRELSKRLGIKNCDPLFRRMVVMVGGARMKLRVRAIIVITKKHDLELVGMTREVTDFLLEYSVGKRDPFTMYSFQYNLKDNTF